MRSLGFSAKEWEVLHGEQYDLTKPLVRAHIKADAQRGRLMAAMLAPPCTTFSIARDRTSVIRDRVYPWGRPDVSERDKQKLKIGNACMRAALDLVMFFHKCGIPWILEHPASSKAWFLPEMKRLEKQPRTASVVGDFC